jgi:glycosyltransferase involved in cell wall biosynthesis
LAGITRRMFDTPVIVHAHERYTGPVPMAKLLSWPVRSADLVIANSNATADFIQAATRGHVRVEVAYNGIPVPDASPTFGPGGAPLRVGCVGRIHPKKGQPVLFDALARAGRDWELHLFGDALPEHAEIEADLRARARSGELGGPVEFHGFVTDTDACYAGIDVSVVPSVRPEEFSLVAAEGQARGCATVVTGPGGVAEVVLDEVTGLVVRCGDADELAKALIRLDDDRMLLERMARAGAARVHEHFTEDAYRERIRVLLDDVLRTT